MLDRQWKTDLRKNRRVITFSLVFFLLAMVLNYLAGLYVDRVGHTQASDIILDNIPVINLSYIYFYGYTLIILLFFISAIWRINEFSQIVMQLSSLIIARSFFITLTHLGNPAAAVILHPPYIFQFLVFTNDLFFSGHTALPFMGYLLFRGEKLGTFFLIATLILAATVLFMHVHYSIDVFAAFFITYGTYRLCQTCSMAKRPERRLR